MERRFSVEIVDLTPGTNDWNVQALEIYDQSLRQKYIPPEDFEKYLRDKEKNVVLGAFIKNNLLGVMLSYVLNPEELTNFTEELGRFGVTTDWGEELVGVIKSVAVREDYRHRGIGTKLTEIAIHRLLEKGCKRIIAISWVSGRPDSSQPLLEKLEFEQLLRVDNYWREDSLRENYMCPVCDNPPCRCTAIFYTKKFE